jgi:aspartate/methionine/tyrosine aminotransferase
MAVRATQDLTQRCRSIIAANADLADAFFKRWHHLFDWKRPAAGPICFPHVKATALAGASIDDWCERCVNECGVLLLPAGVYDHAASSAGGHFRLSLGRASCGSCLKVLDAWLEQKYGAPAP